MSWLFCSMFIIAHNNSTKNSSTKDSTHFKLSAKDIINDSVIVYPESMTDNLGELLSSWQLDLTLADIDCKRGENIVFHDTVYANRLYSLPTEMELSYNSVVKSHIDMYASRRRDQVSYMLALGEYYFPIFEEVLDRHGLPLELKYLPVIESALNPIAVSRVGATGLWQFMLRTGKGYGLEVNSLIDERRDPYKSTEAAVKYLKDLYTIYGDWNLVIAAYNCGPGNVNKAIARSGGSKDYWEIYYRLPRETRGYVPAFIAANYIMNHYADHNICPAHSGGTNVALDTIHVNEQVHFEQIAGVLDIPISEIKRLNPQFKKDKIPGDKMYALVLPTERMYAFIDQNDSIMNYNRDRYYTHRLYTDNYLDGTSSYSDGSSVNVYYRVKSGDNLSTIARRNGTTVARIKAWNGLTSDRLNIGKRLVVGKKVVPPTQQKQVEMAQVKDGNSNTKTINTYYRVKKGDTLGEIAAKNNIPLSKLRSWNSLTSSRINIGDRLIVGQKVEEIEVTTESPESSEESGSNIISDYLKQQIENVSENKEVSDVVEAESHNETTVEKNEEILSFEDISNENILSK